MRCSRNASNLNLYLNGRPRTCGATRECLDGARKDKWSRMDGVYNSVSNLRLHQTLRGRLMKVLPSEQCTQQSTAARRALQIPIR